MNSVLCFLDFIRFYLISNRSEPRPQSTVKISATLCVFIPPIAFEASHHLSSWYFCTSGFNQWDLRYADLLFVLLLTRHLPVARKCFNAGNSKAEKFVPLEPNLALVRPSRVISKAQLHRSNRHPHQLSGMSRAREKLFACDRWFITG
jgi:hypothetical protein